MHASEEQLRGGANVLPIRSVPTLSKDRPLASAEFAAPTPRVVLRTEQVTVDRSGGFGAMYETTELPVLALYFDYGNQRIAACDPRDRFFSAGF